MNRPPAYTPTSLRQMQERRQVAYGIGLPKGAHDLGMMFGPVPTLLRCLEQPGVDGAVIVRFNRDGTDEITWRFQGEQWKPEPAVNHYDYHALTAIPPRLTAEDVRSLLYFAIEKDDPTRWVDWLAKQALVREQLPDFYTAWHEREAAQRRFVQVAKELAERVDTIKLDYPESPHA